MRVYLFGIEPYPDRYSEQWSRWLPAAFAAEGLDVVDVRPERPVPAAAAGSDPMSAVATAAWKSGQLSAFAAEVASGGVPDDAALFLADAWMPGVELVAYMRAMLGTRWRIYGVLHAGTWDPDDFTVRYGFDRWARGSESTWLRLLDHLFLGSEFHAGLIRSVHGLCPSRYTVTGIPVVAEEVVGGRAKRSDLVVWPHRACAEKGEGDWLRLAAELRGLGLECVSTRDVCKDKASFYGLLSEAAVAVSTARQETFGISMVEAALNGCAVVAPLRLSYPEVLGGYAGARLYGSLREAVGMVVEACGEVRRGGPFPAGGLRFGAVPSVWARAIAERR